MHRVIIVHCWDGYPEYCWYPWAKQQLEKDGVAVSVPAFPDTAHPNRERWCKTLSETVGTADEHTFLVGHSVGCVTIMRYLESLPQNVRIGGAVFVAGFTDDLGFAELKNFFTEAINFEKIKAHCRHFVAIHSTDDPYVPLRHSQVFEKKLGATIIIKANAGHFSGSNDPEPPNAKTYMQLPEVVNSILQFTQL